MECPNCNHENAADAIHCTNCGIAINNNTEDEMTPPISKSEKIAEIEKRRNYKRKKKQQKKIVLIALTIAIAAGIISAAAYWISSSIIDKTDKDSTIIVTTKPTESAIPRRTTLPVVTEEPIPSNIPLVTTVPANSQEITPHDATVSQSPSVNGVSEQVEYNPQTTKAPATKKPIVTKTPSKPKATVKPATPKPTKTPAPVPTEPPIRRPLNFHPGGVPAQPISQNATTESFSQLMQVTDHITDGSTGRAMIKFRAGNTDYFAYNDDNTIPQGSVGYFTAMLCMSEFTYNELPVYNMTNVADCRNGYILPTSNTAILSESDIAHLSKAELRLARNEIFARHGRAFEGQELHEYFSSKDWYSINQKYDYADDKINVTDIEWKNAEFLLSYSK